MKNLVPLFSLLCLCCGAHKLREYKGYRLTPVAEFPESSIKGPQYVDINKYRLKVVGLVERHRPLGGAALGGPALRGGGKGGC